MQVSAAILCDYASVREGLLFVQGGGITRMWREQFPASMQSSLGLLLELHQMEASRRHDFELLIQSEDGDRLLDISGSFELAQELAPGETALFPLALDLRQATLKGPGAYTIEIVIDGTHHKTVQFQARPTAEIS